MAREARLVIVRRVISGMTCPDLNGEYSESYRDNDSGNVRMQCRVRHQDDGIQVTLIVVGDEECGVDYAPFPITKTGLVRDENAQEKTPTRREYRSSGTIEHVYEERPLVRIRLANGAPLYFDVEKRQFVLADWFAFVAPCSFDGRNEAHVTTVLHVLARMAQVIAPEVRLWDTSSTNQLHRSLEEWISQPDGNFALGSSDFAHFVVGMYRNEVAYVRVSGLSGGAILSAYCGPGSAGGVRGVTFSAHDLPEHHAALAAVAAAFSLPPGDSRA